MDTEQATVPYGYCHCGCGELAPIIPESNRRRGYVRGEPYRYILGHGTRRATPRLSWDVDPETGCWNWTAGTLADCGYGRVTVNGRLTKAHRYTYEQANGPIAPGLTLDHLCRNRACVNPAHLEPVSIATNCRRGAAARVGWSGAMMVRLMAATTTLNHGEIGEIVGLGHTAVCGIVHNQRWKVPTDA